MSARFNAVFRDHSLMPAPFIASWFNLNDLPSKSHFRNNSTRPASERDGWGKPPLMVHHPSSAAADVRSPEYACAPACPGFSARAQRRHPGSREVCSKPTSLSLPACTCLFLSSRKIHFTTFSVAVNNVGTWGPCSQTIPILPATLRPPSLFTTVFIHLFRAWHFGQNTRHCPFICRKHASSPLYINLLIKV